MNNYQIKSLEQKIEFLEKQLQQCEEQRDELQVHYDNYRVLCDSIINKEEVLYDLTKVSKSTLELILPLFDYVKSDIVARSIKMLDKPQFVFYLN
jgi:chromosome segregation ATPase